MIELTYRRPVARLLTVQPDLQCVLRPSGRRTIRDALAVGMRFELGM